MSMESSIKLPLLDVHDDELNMEISLQQETAKGGWRSAIYIIGVEVAERFTYFGTSGNLMTYLTNVLNESTATAAKNVNIWSGVAALLPLLGAFIADSYLGRFRAILFASFIYVMGLIMLMISVSVIPLRFQHGIFFFSLYLVAIGGGGFKPCVQTFGADQFDDNIPEEKKAKSSFFNWWYFGVCTGASAGILVVFYVQDNVSWLIGFGIPGLAMVLALVLFLFGKGLYRQHIPSGSPLTRVVQVFVAASCKRNLSIPKDVKALLPEEEEIGMVTSTSTNIPSTVQFKCLDKATIIDEIDSRSETRNNWRLGSVAQVEEAKLILRLIPVWFGCLMYAITLAQIETFFTKQGSTMNRRIGNSFYIPPASLQASTGLVIALAVPIYDRVFVPAARKLTGLASGITMLQRIGIGMLFSVLAMVVAALAEARRVEIASSYGLLDQPNTTVPMSIWWLLPQYVVSGLSNVFTVVGLQELFYDQMPDATRSIGSAACLSIFGVGSLLSSVLISIVRYVTLRAGDEWLGDNLNRAHLDFYYWLLAGLSSLWLGVFICVSMSFMYKKIHIEIRESESFLVPMSMRLMRFHIISLAKYRTRVKEA